MRKYSGLFVFLGFGLAFVLFFVFFVYILPEIESIGDYANITALDYKAVVVDEKDGDRGKVRITERITFDIHAASTDNLFWELWRDLPEEYVDGVKVEYDVVSVKRLSVNGDTSKEQVFTEAKKLYWYDSDYTSTQTGLGPNKWYHSKGPYDGEYNFECVLFYVDGLYREKTVFEIEYEMYNASMRYGDCSELYLTLFAGDDVDKLDSLNGQILVPDNKMPSAGNYDAHTYGTNSHTFDFTESDTANAGYHTFSFGLDKSQLEFKAYNKYIEFAMVSYGEDMHKFTEFASKNTYYNKNVHADILKAQAEYDGLPQAFLTAKIVVVIILSVLAIALLLLIILIDRRNQKKYGLLKPAQEFDFYREIPSPTDATFAAALTFCKHKYKDSVPGGYAAAMLGLVKKRYIDIVRINDKKGWDQDNVRITVNKIMFDPFTGQKLLPALTRSEELYLELIHRHAKQGESISMKNFEDKVANDYQNTESFKHKTDGVVTSIGMSDGYFKQADYKKPKRTARNGVIFLCVLGVISMLINLITFTTRLELAFGAFFILGAGFFAAAALLWQLAKKYVLLKQFGADEYAKWRGLYKFLKSETLIKERVVPEIAIWEEYLIYATAFGISEKVIKALNIKYPEYTMPGTGMAGSFIIMNPYFRTRAFTRIYVHSFRSSVRRASHISRSGSHGGGGGFGGGFGGGGYGGGGRGGGGGGGGH